MTGCAQSTESVQQPPEAEATDNTSRPAAAEVSPISCRFERVREIAVVIAIPGT